MTSNVDGNTTVKAAFERASQFVRAGDLQLAESICRKGLERFPQDGNLLCLMGGILVRQHRPVEAEQALRRVIMRFPDFAKAHEELGNALLAQRRLEEAAQCLRVSVDLEPGNDIARMKLDKIQAASKRPDEKPAGPGFLQEVLARDPDNPNAYRLMAAEAMQQGHTADAVVLLKKALSIDSGFTAGWLDLGRSLAGCGAFAEAVDAMQSAIELEPASPLLRALQAGFLSRVGRYDDAIAAYEDGLQIDPGNTDCLLGLGHANRTIGRQDEAVRAYRELARAKPDCGEAYWSIANLKNVVFAEVEIRMMLEQIDRDELDDDSRTYLQFSLAKAYEDLEDFDNAFALYEDGNANRRSRESYDAVEFQADVDKIIAQYSQTYLDERRDTGDPDPAPIFIVGLPRSGSTLVEQILASHSHVDGTRELPYVEQLVVENVAQGENPDFAQLGRLYLDLAWRHRAGGSRFTDKTPGNFRHIGLLSLMLPNAKFVNVRRHPLDSCLGSYKQLFASGYPYSYDLFELGEYYLQYRRLIDHWHDVLPGRMLDVHYEILVADPEPQIRRLLEYCELEWEDACLHFHETDRAIESASSEQVRLPIYTTAVNNWRHYEDKLGELIEILQPLLLELPQEQRPAGLA